MERLFVATCSALIPHRFARRFTLGKTPQTPIEPVMVVGSATISSAFAAM